MRKQPAEKRLSLHAFRKAGAVILKEFAQDPLRRKVLLNELTRLANGEGPHPDRNPEIRVLLVGFVAEFLPKPCERKKRGTPRRSRGGRRGGR